MTKKPLQLPLFFSLCSSLQKIWTDRQKLLIEFSTFVNIEECGSVRIHRENVIWQIFIQIWNFMTCHDKCFRENNNGGSKWTYHLFHVVNSVLYAVSNIYPKTEILLKVITVFNSKNLTLFKGTSIHSIRKSTKNRNSETIWKVTEDSRPCKAQTDPKTEKWSWQIAKYFMVAIHCFTISIWLHDGEKRERVPRNYIN